MTRITVRPCPFRPSEMLRQSGVHPVLARIYAARGLLDVRELSSARAALRAAIGRVVLDVGEVEPVVLTKWSG